MWFLYPAFLIGAIAIAIPVVLHLMRRAVAPEVPFSAVRLLRRTPLEQTRRRRLRELLLLAARVAALLLLAAAFARPYVTAGGGASRLHVVAIDRSFSMGAPGRFERALDLARAAIQSSSRTDRVAVIAFDDHADVIAPPGAPGAARAALEGTQPGFGGTRYGPVVQRAIELAAQGGARLSVISDLQRAGWEDQEPLTVPAGVEVELHDAGAPARNAAVMAVRHEPAVIVVVRNDGPQPFAGNARVLLDGRPVASAPFSAAPGATVDVPVGYQAPERGDLLVEIDDREGYAADNRRYVVLDVQRRTRVLVVGGGAEASGFFLTQALQTAGGDGAFEVRAVSGASLGRIDAQEFSKNGAVVLLSTRSLDRRARELLTSFVRGGGGLLVAASPDIEPAVLGTIMGWSDFSAVEQSADPVVLAATDLRHPIFQPFGALAANLGQVRFTRAWRVRGEGWEAIARFTDGTPALLERRQEQGRVVLFASDVDRRWNDFPLNPAFVPFALEAVRHVALSVDARRDYPVGQAPPETKPEPGIYTRQSDRQRIAVNVDVRESTTARVTPEEFTAMLRQGEPQADAPIERRAQQIEGRQNLWQYGLMLMLGALIAESVVGRAR